jgi:hypothetical protein
MGHTPYSGKQEPHAETASSSIEESLVSTNGSGTAGIVLRATVETFGPAGDAELHLTVKWPAAALAAAQRTPPPKREDPTPSTATNGGDGYDTEGNIHTRRSSPAEQGSHKPEA